MIFLILCLFYLVIILAFVYLFLQILYLRQGPPFVLSTDDDVKNILSFAKRYKAKKILDLGCGDGKLIIALAREGFLSDGIEINPILATKAKRKIKKLNIKSKIIVGNFWNHDVSNYDVIVMYVVNHIMPRLERKLKKELKSGSYVISNFATFPSLKPIAKKGRVKIYRIKN